MTMPKLTEYQEWVLREVRRQEKRNGFPLTRWISEALYTSDLNRYGRGLRWQSRSEAANPHIASLIRKGMLVRPHRGEIKTTPLGKTWLVANPAPTD